MDRVQLPEDLEEDIRALLPGVPFQGEHVSSRDVLTEESLDELKAHLESNSLTKPWSDSPRLYALLRMSAGVGEEDLTKRPYSDKDLLALGLSDYALPFSAATLPTAIREQVHTSRRLPILQRVVKSSPEMMSFRDGDLRHRNSKIIPFSTTSQLPEIEGSFGKVESVRNTRSGLIFARKTMPRLRLGPMSDRGAQADRQWRLEHFKNEVEILQKLDHEHLVRFCGSYTDENAFALLVQPVAERTLHQLLVQPELLNSEDITMLRKSFGCLAFGLAWLHSKLIRHKDIKPANILISAGSMLFCDFGSAMDAEFLDTTQTEGFAQKRTPRYISPETHEQKQRNEASDVWSLGCVFLEMLMVLTNSSVDELLNYIHHGIGRSGPVDDVCYWEGASSDLLRIRTAQIANVPKVQFMANWTRKMVEKAPEERPSAATLVEAAQSHENAQSEPGHIGSCCAKSKVPNLPKPRQPEPSPPLSVPPKTWISFNSLPTTGFQPPEGGVVMTGSLPLGSARTHSSEFRVDSPRQNTGQSATSVGSHESVPVFQAPLTAESFRILEPLPSSGNSFSYARSLRLYELPETDLYRTTRRLIFLPNEDFDLAEGLEFWMPLADISVVRREARVIISWSDCNHHEPHDTKNGITPHSRVYKRMKPNNTLLIHFETEEDARVFTSKISEPDKEKVVLQGWPINLSPYSTNGAWGFDANGGIQKYSVSPEVAYTVQPFDCQMSETHRPSRGLLMKTGDDSTMSTSRIYWLPHAIDIKLEQDYMSDRTEFKPSVSLMDLFAVNYKSNVQKVHNSLKDKVGVCQHIELSTCSVSWRFENAYDRHSFLDGISTWSLQQCTPVNCVWKKSRFSWSEKGKANLLFWSNEKGGAAVTFRLEEATSGKGQWITGHLMTPGASESYTGLTATIKLTSYCRDEKLDLRSMDAVPAGSPDLNPKHHDTSKSQAIKIEFHLSNDMTNFQEQIGRYRRAYSDGVGAIHNSSMSSDGFGARALAHSHSLSIQNTSSSSRQS